MKSTAGASEKEKSYLKSVWDLVSYPFNKFGLNMMISNVSIPQLIYNPLYETFILLYNTPDLFPKSPAANPIPNHHSTVQVLSVDQGSLTNLVKSRDVKMLQTFNGVTGLAESLHTSLENGINSHDVENQRTSYCSNWYKKPTQKGFIQFVVESFSDIIVLILLACATLSLCFGMKVNGAKEGWYEGASIFLAVFMVIIVSAVTDFRQAREFERCLSKVSNNIEIEAIRDGRRTKISISDVVVGDVIILNIGDQVPADGLFINGHSLLMDESSVTGECDYMEIDAVTNPFLFSGSKVVDGHGKMLVISVGMNTDWGEMMSSITTDDYSDQTPLYSRLDELASSIGTIGLAVVVLVLAVMLIRYFTGHTKDENGNREYNGKHTNAYEIIGSVTRFFATALAILFVAVPICLPLAVPFTLAYSIKRMMADQAMVRKLFACEAMGSATLICTHKTGTLTLNKMKVDPAYEDDTIHVHWKGAAAMVLAMCSNFYQKNGLIESINQEERTRFENIIQGMAANSLRCMAFAHYEVGTSYKSLNKEGLTLLGIVGIKDPCRPGVKEAIDTCRSAGVAIKMITGDNVFTAKAIATELGILELGQQENKGEVVEGEEFHNYTEGEKMDKVDNIRVMARSSPLDKLLMVQCLKRKGHVVAVTGGGTNASPVLKEADIGLSMGIQGSEVAKVSSDIIILDDNFASVVPVISWGRYLYNNIQTFVQFQLTAIVAALVIIFVAAVFDGEIPLTAVQLLWVNLIMTTLGALALATEQPTKELMHKPPINRDAPLITNIMWRNLLAQSLYQITVLLTFLFGGKQMFSVDERVKNTMIFNTFVLCQVFNVFNSRNQEKSNVFEGLDKNRLFMGIVGVTIVVQVLLVEFLKNFAVAEKLNGKQWGICFGFASLSWPMGMFVKLIPVPEKAFSSYIEEWFNKRT
ncbi:putative calcium-transporting ATPase 13, plasma membrane-type [Rutidosis leptorrhynchoides]|uniref:putative calcium-transporting ATPase 13, plasma membrane-type n=1 Tax=Rutidosis leptorrhynchoides TaxID=125765 RepID=UPI003A9A1CA2